jgi:hypothetical protein
MAAFSDRLRLQFRWQAVATMAAFDYNGFDGLASFGHNGRPLATRAGCEAAASINGLWFSAASINGLWVDYDCLAWLGFELYCSATKILFQYILGIQYNEPTQSEQNTV